jgi:hypothetical protein
MPPYAALRQAVLGFIRGSKLWTRSAAVRIHSEIAGRKSRRAAAYVGRSKLYDRRCHSDEKLAWHTNQSLQVKKAMSRQIVGAMCGLVANTSARHQRMTVMHCRKWTSTVSKFFKDADPYMSNAVMKSDAVRPLSKRQKAEDPMAHEPSPSKNVQNFVKAGFAEVEDAVKRGLNKPAISIAALLDQWLLDEAKYTHVAHRIRRPPASCSQIADAEARLGFLLPSQLKDLLLASDGIDWVMPPGAPLLPRVGYFPPASALNLAGNLARPLSSFVQETRRRARQRGTDPDAVDIGEPGIWSFLSPPTQRIQFDDLDALLALQIPTHATCLLMVPRPMPGLAPGTVLDFEGLRATRYESLAHWLSVQIELSTCIP